MLTKIWPSAQPDAIAQQMMSVIAKRLVVASFLVMLATLVYAFRLEVDYLEVMALAVKKVFEIDQFLLSTNAYIFYGFSSLVLSSVVHFRNIPLILSFGKAKNLSAENFRKALSLAQASRLAARAHFLNLQAVAFFKCICLVPLVLPGHPSIMQSILVILFLMVVMLLPETPFLSWVFMPFEGTGDKLGQTLKALNTPDTLDWSYWDNESNLVSFSGTATALTYLLAVRSGRVAEYTEVIDSFTSDSTSQQKHRKAFEAA